MDDVEELYVKELIEKVSVILGMDVKAVSNMTYIETIDELTKAFESRG